MDIFVENVKWKRSTGLVFWGTAIQTTFSFLCLAILSFLLYDLTGIIFSGILPSMSNMSLDFYEDTFRSFGVAILLCGLISFLGYILYLIGISLFKGAQKSLYSELKAKNIMLTELSLLAFQVLLIIFVYNCHDTVLKDLESVVTLAVIVFIVSMAAVIFLLIQFKSLSKEESWPDKTRKGADDVRFSYICILVLVGILIIGCGVIGFTIYSSLTRMNALYYQSYGLNEAFGGIDSLARMIDNLLSNIRIELMFFCLLALFFGLLHTFYRIRGWRMIQTGGNKEVHVNNSNSVTQRSNSGLRRYCHKCGIELPEGSAFCPGCGTRVLEFTVSENTDPDRGNEAQAAEQYIPGANDSRTEQNYLESNGESDGYYEDEENDKHKKWLLWGGVVAGIAIIAGVWAIFFHSDKIEPNARVLVNHSVLFKSVENGIGTDPLEDVEYGTPVECKAAEFDKDGIWMKATIENKGKILSGYMTKADLINPEDFLILEKGGLSDSDISKGIPYNSERIAILYALKRSEGNWNIDVLNTNGENQPNLRRLKVSGARPSEDCVAFILRNEDNKDERTLFLYSTPDIYSPGNTREPVYLYSEPVKEGNVAVSDVKLRKKGKKYDVTYTKAPGKNTNIHEVTEYPAEEPALKQPQFGGTLEMVGYIDGKYEVRMEVIEFVNGSITGDYVYVKNNRPISLSGKYTQSGDRQEIWLEESFDGNVTGKFIGSYDGFVFSGTWISADGSREMPFRLER